MSHAILSPSSFKANSLCLGRRRMNEPYRDLADESTDEAKLGTAGHELLEKCLSRRKEFPSGLYFDLNEYKDEHGTWNENLNFTLLKVWVSEKTGWEYTNKEKWTRTHGYKAYLKFDMEKEE